MTSRYSRREVLKRGALALPALHAGFNLPSIVNALANEDGQTNRFEQLQLDTNLDQLESMRKFYGDTLNLPLVAEDAKSLSIQAGRTRIKFSAKRDRGSPFYHFAFNIPENRLEESIEWLSSRARLLKTRDGNHVVHFKWLDAHSVYFYDPAGNILEFIAHHSLPNARKGQFDVDDILYASEIGLVTEDVPALSAELATRVGVTNYASKFGRPASSVFQPIGDPHGFFIVVQDQRTWLMTDTPAERHPVTVAMSGHATRELKLESCDCTIVMTT